MADEPSGARTCIGKNISVLETTKVLPQIVRKSDLVLERHRSSWIQAVHGLCIPSIMPRLYHDSLETSAIVKPCLLYRHIPVDAYA